MNARADLAAAGVLWCLLLLPACGAAPARASQLDWQVHIAPAPTLDTMAVSLCFPAALPARLIPGVPAAARWLRSARVRGGPSLAVSNGALTLPAGTGCVDYTIDLRAAAESGSTAAAVRSSPGQWLWRPAKLPAPEQLRVTLTATLPDGMSISLPWPQVALASSVPSSSPVTAMPSIPSMPSAAPRAWHIPWNALRYRSNMLIGRFDAAQLPVAGGVLDVAFIGDPPTDRTRFDRWLVQSAADVATVYGLFPVPSAQVLVIFERDDDVGFGATARGGGPGVILHVGRETSSQTLAEDWTATHELFHLGMPLIERNDAWLSEGVTTVYTYIAMARSGRITPAEAFAEIAAGFARGEAYGTGRPLAQESVAMHQTHAYWRVYWGGGAWTLDRMVALAAAGQNFDEVLLQWSTINRDPGPARTAAELLRWSDRAGNPASSSPRAPMPCCGRVTSRSGRRPSPRSASPRAAGRRPTTSPLTLGSRSQ